ncbi:MAG: flagellar basal body P-ring protein FlgI [Bdellovibrionales bacterium]|nr:flagellar basal body P-ring protein FlgI [Bdellovibrionales bacterium]
MTKSFSRICIIVVLLVAATSGVAHAARLKDIAQVEGVRGNQLFGYGLVVGLNGTGDGNAVDFTNKSISNMLERVGLSVSSDEVKVKNVASVMVTATLPPFARPGLEIDVTLSSLGDARSLQGGTLLLTPLKAPDGNVYAVAQGAVTVGGFSVSSGGDAVVQNHPTVGTIASGAYVERSIPFDLFQSKQVRIVLREPDFTTMTRVVDEINKDLGRPLAVALDAGSVEIPLVDSFALDPIGFVARLEQLDVSQDARARVIVNEKTGTIVMGEHVTVSQVALAHGNLSIAIRSETQVSQPEPLSEEGETAVVTNTDVQVGEDTSGLSLVGGEVTLGELVNALNALGATPRDLISIFTALQRAGALQAELTIM